MLKRSKVLLLVPLYSMDPVKTLVVMCTYLHCRASFRYGGLNWNWFGFWICLQNECQAHASHGSKWCFFFIKLALLHDMELSYLLHGAESFLRR